MGPQHARSEQRRDRSTAAASVSSRGGGGGGHPAVREKIPEDQRREGKLRPVRLLRWRMSGRRVRVARPNPVTRRGNPPALARDTGAWEEGSAMQRTSRGQWQRASDTGPESLCQRPREAARRRGGGVDLRQSVRGTEMQRTAAAQTASYAWLLVIKIVLFLFVWHETRSPNE